VSTLTNCSNSSKLNSESTQTLLPTKIDINSVFNFRQFGEDANTIYPYSNNTIQTSGLFCSKPNERTIRPLLDNYINPEFVSKT
jgi:hypothetical protein